jgi:ribosomal protein S18 acetylase RimI-like enzyme
MIGTGPPDIVPADPALRLRLAGAADEAFLRRLFDEVRRGQFAATGLSGPVLDQIIAQQFRSQTVGYAAQFPDAVPLIILHDMAAIGRLLLHCARDRWHVVDIALLPADCGRGLGSGIFDALELSARARGIAALTLTVLASNRAAHRFYARRGFAEIGSADGAHIAMRKSLAA